MSVCSLSHLSCMTATAQLGLARKPLLITYSLLLLSHIAVHMPHVLSCLFYVIYDLKSDRVVAVDDSLNFDIATTFLVYCFHTWTNVW